MSSNEINSFLINELFVGQKAQITRIVSLDDILSFSKLTNDYHPLHTDKNYALRNGFNDIIAHGLLLSSFSSALIGMKLPGKNTIIMNQSFDYLTPVYPNEELIITGVIEKINIRFSFVEIKVKIFNEKELKAKGSFMTKIRT